MNKLEIVNEYFYDNNITSMSADGFDDGILGIVDEKIAYSVTKCIEILMTRDKMSMEDAIEYFEFNIRGAYVGKLTPIWVDDGILY